ncbi:MAG: hypothetical protein K5636_02590 [Bacteroidales bacterium]|nr:hypothetical protein [Bacteroidales bacterium]
MEDKKLNILERFTQVIKQFIDRITYSQELFEDDVWVIRLSKKHQGELKYTVDKKLFSWSLKTGDDVYKYMLLLAMAAMLVVMLLMSRDVGISSRELEQDHYSALVYDHFHHTGDPEAYRTHPYASTQAQYIDLIVYSVCKALNVTDTFAIRHLLSAFFGWLLILYLSILILRAFNWRAAFFTAFFLFISPRFFGYSLSNMVDVTFAFGFIFTITQMYYFCRELPVIRIYRCVKILIGIFIALSTYNAGYVLIHFFVIFTLLNFFLYNPLKKIFSKEYLKALGMLCILLIGSTLIVYGLHAICTHFLVSSAVAPRNAFKLLTINYPLSGNQLFKGHVIGPDNFPKGYLSTYLFITIPTIILIGFLLFFIFFKTAVKSLKIYSIFIFLYSFFYCIHQVRLSYINPDTLWAIYYFIYPLFMLIAVSGVECALRTINDKYTNFVVFCIIGLLSFLPIRHILVNNPVSSLYFNEISGGINNAYAKYELDCNDDANKTACQWLGHYIFREDLCKGTKDSTIIIATNGNQACDLFFRQESEMIKMEHKPYSKTDTTWDYYIDFCNNIPAAQLRNGTWPNDKTIHCINIESKPIVAIYRNSYKMQQKTINDSIAAVQAAYLDSLASLPHNASKIRKNKR